MIVADHGVILCGIGTEMGETRKVLVCCSLLHFRESGVRLSWSLTGVRVELLASSERIDDVLTPRLHSD